MYVESRWRSIAKAVSWRFWATVTTVVLVRLFTGKTDVAMAVGGIEVFLKIIFQYFHERVWNRVRFGKRAIEPAVIWLTGLSGSGKTQLAQHLHGELCQRGLKAELLEGDQIRALFPEIGFDRSDRDLHIRRVGHLARRLESQGVFVVASFVSPFRESREFVRNVCRRFVEVHISTPLEECRKRDLKGLYARADRGEVKNVAGLDFPYETPERPNLEVNLARTPVPEAATRVVQLLRL